MLIAVSNRSTPLFAAGSALLFLGFFVSYYSQTLEDAYITARYALRLVEGYPYGTWNRDSVSLVEGSTTTIWPFFMALGGKKQVLFDVAKLVSAGTFLAALFVIWKAPMTGAFSNQLISKHSPLLALVACGVYAPFGWYAASGMESIFFASLVAIVAFLPLTALDSRLLHLTLCGVLCLTRPDGLLIAVFVSGFYAYLDSRWLWVLASVLLFFSLIFIMRYLYFGYWYPNPLYAKAGDGFLYVRTGLGYVKSFLIAHWYLFIPIGIGLINWRKLKRLHVAITLGLLAFAILIVKTGGDNPYAFPFWRHFVQLMPLMAFLAFEGIAACSYRVRELNTILLAALLFAPLLPSQNAWGGGNKLRADLFSNAPTATAEWIAFVNHISNKETVIASALAGELPFNVDAVHLDMLGLNDVHIAHYGTFDPAGPTDSKTDMAYVFNRRPDILEAYFSATEYSSGRFEGLDRSWRGQMIRNTLCNAEFLAYAFVANAPYRTWNRATFVHETFIENSKHLAEYDLQPNRENAALTTFLDHYCRSIRL